MRAHVGWDKSSKSHRTIAKKVGQLHHSWPSSLFHRLFCRLEVGQLGQLHPFPPFLREGEVSPEPPSVFIGRRRDFKATNASKKVGQIGQVPYFIGFCCRLEVGQLGKLHPFPPLLREGKVPPEPTSVFIGRRRDFKATNTSKKVGKVGQVPYFIDSRCSFEVGQVDQLRPSCPFLREGEVPPESSCMPLFFTSFPSLTSVQNLLFFSITPEPHQLTLKTSNDPTRTSPRRLMAAGTIRFQLIPNCQNSRVIVTFRFSEIQASRGDHSTDSLA